MAKLSFKYGVVGSAKTAFAAIHKYQLEEKGFKTIMLKPTEDTRDGAGIMKSGVPGLTINGVYSIEKNESILSYLASNKINPDVIFIDEVQFFTPNHIKELRYIASQLDIDVICYGLRTDFQGNLWEASQTLFALADDISEIECTCECGAKAIINARVVDGQVVSKGDIIQISKSNSDKGYKGMCWKCWKEALIRDVV